MKSLLISLLFIVSSCVDKQPGTSILTSGIFNKATFTIEQKDASGKTIDLGEHLLTEPPKILKVEVYNGTNYPYTELKLLFSAADDQSPSTNFLANRDGEVQFPGQDGTCTRTLPPGKRCSIFIEVNPRESRIYNEFIKLSYKQYVELEEHQATLNFLAGMPASLTFTNDQTQFIFGTPAGPNSLPVVERADQQSYQETIEIINAGGLSATDLNLSLDESCVSSLTALCPSGMFGAYRFEHNCPNSLFPGKTCQATIYYLPLNKNPESGITPDDIKEISYRGTITARYQTDSTGRSAALNAYFNSVSTDIEARFATTNAVINFDQPVISGNRDTRFITVRNMGYRTGYLHSLAVRDPSSNIIANCFKGSDNYLRCLDLSDQLVPLTTLPFRIKDRNSCLSAPDEKKEIQVSQGCIFDFYFQPSVSFINDKLTEFMDLQVFTTYDAYWKAQEKIVTVKLSTLHAKSTAAGRIVIDKIRFNGTEYFNYDGITPPVANLGRLTLQSPNYAVFRSLLITFKNIGSTAVSNISLSDGTGRNIPIGGSGITFGSKIPYYYKSVIASDSTCTTIEPQGQCTLSMMFSPIGLDSNANEDLNMFDQVSSSPKIKTFTMTYNSGAKFTDENIDSTGDYPLQIAQSHLTAQLIRKGMLMALTDDIRNFADFGNNQATLNDEIHTYVYLRNIGTGPVPYIQHYNPPISSGASPNYSWSLIPTLNPTSLGAEYDCLNIVDTNLSTATNGTVQPQARTGFFNALPKDESCVYTVKLKYSDLSKRMNPYNCTNIPTNAEEANRLFYRGGGADLWEVCRSNQNSSLVKRFRYFDGDLLNENRNNVDYGNQFNLDDYRINTQLSATKKLNFNHFTPLITATLYRPGFTLPDLATGNPEQAEKIIPEAWFYGPSTYFHYLFSDPLNSNPFIKGNYSRIPLAGTAQWANRDNYDYIYFMGSFPQASGNLTVVTSPYNSGTSGLRVLGISQAAVAGTGLTLPSTATFPRNLGGGAAITPFNFVLNTSTAGEHGRVVEFNIETGEFNQPVKFFQSRNISNSAELTVKTRKIKVLFLANILPTTSHPKITLEVQDIDVTQNDGAPPTEIPQTPAVKNLSWNYNNPVETLVFDSVKLNTTPGPNDSYAKKILTLKNNTAHPIYDLRYLYRSGATATNTSTVSTNFTTISAGTNCAFGLTLAPGESCTITYRYQPRVSDANEDRLITFMYRSFNNEYFTENIGLSLMPRAPGALVAVAKTKQTINYKSTPTSSSVTRDSYNLPYPQTTFSALPTTISFTQETGTLAKIEIENLEETKTSLLLSYQYYLTRNNLRGYSNATPAGSSVVPDTYFTRSDGLDYAPIYLSKYPNTQQRIIVEASRGCFFGDDEFNGAIPPHQKGFSRSSVAPCFLRIALSANFDYLNKLTTNINPDDMHENAFELWYYSVNRSSTSSIWFHLTGKIIPNPALVAGTYQNIEALDNRTVSFSTPTFTPVTADLGPVTGIRVYMSDNKNMLTNLYATPGDKYVDIRSSDGDKWWANFSSNLKNGQYFYFKAAAIRYHSSFNHTAERFPGLLPGEYISQASASTILDLVVPPLGHSYVHSQKTILEKNIVGGISAFTWPESAAKCAARNITLKNPNNINKQYRLMDMATWEIAKKIPASHSYSPHLGTAHWLSDGVVLIDTVLGGQPEFNPGSDSQMIESIKTFYYRSSVNRNDPVRLVVGGVPSTSAQDWLSLVAPEITFANARCMIKL